jgi:hypothetical protein
VPKPTCRTIPGGGSFLRRDNAGRVIHVPETHLALRCEIGECEWFLLFPVRLGLDRIEALRQFHVGQIHWRELVEGRAQISEQELEWTPSGSSLSLSQSS